MKHTRAAMAVLANFHGPNEVRSTWHLNPESVARAVFASIDTDDLAEALALEGESACFDREALGESYGMRVWENDRDHYRRIAEAVKAHLLKEDS